jgi:hypothetical protein
LRPEATEQGEPTICRAAAPSGSKTVRRAHDVSIESQYESFARIAPSLVLRNKARIFPNTHDLVEVLDIELSRPKFVRGDRYHCQLTVHYRIDGVAKTMRMWLKFRPQLHALLPVLDAYHARLNGQVFPKAYFAWCALDTNTAVLATAYVQGATLRNKLLMLALLRQTSRLCSIFRSTGAKMRRFHDAFPSSESIEIAPLVNSTAALLRETTYFSEPEKISIRSHLERYAGALSIRALPAIQVHNDWILRNIIVAADGVDYIVDFDSMRARADLRWLDVAYFLLNIASQLKWAPLVTAGSLAELSHEFWRGYVGEADPPDSLSPEQMAAILYLVRLRYLLGGTTRPAYFRIMDGPLDYRALRSLKESVVMGQAAQFDLQ